MAVASSTERIRRFVEGAFHAAVNEPAGGLRHPFIDPGGGYRGILWDWDAYFCLLGLEPWADRVADVARGCVQNFMDHQRDDGSIPYCFTEKAGPPGKERPADSPANSAKPLIAQFALMAARYQGSGVRGQESGACTRWLAQVYPALARHCGHWEETQQHSNGLFTFRSHRGSGSDDHPAVYCRPFNSSADVFLNSLMVEEYKAMGEIVRLCGSAQPRPPAEQLVATGSGDGGRTCGEPCWIEKAEGLAEKMRELMWDPIDGAFYNLDVGRGDPGKVNQEVTWPVPLKFKSWTCVMPLWARVATDEQAERFVFEHLLNPDELRSPYGIRSLAMDEPAYEIAVGSNPSCWRGPIWIVANYLAWKGLKNYGFDQEADELAVDITDMMACDIEQNSCLHEYYHPDPGEGLTHPGFLNWNTLATIM